MWRVALILQLAAALFFGWLFYTRFWLWRACIAAAESSCVTPDGDNLVAAGALWSVPALLFLLLALRTLFRHSR